MQTRIPSNHPAQSGYVLLMTLVFAGVALVAFGSMMAYVATNAKITARNNLFNQTEAAAESTTENILAAMMRDFENQNLNSPGAYTSLLPTQTGWPIQFQLFDTNGVANRISLSIGQTNWAQLPATYTGLYGMGQNCTLAATARPLGQSQDLSATVSQSIWFGSIPVFQYAILYNMDLEINPGNTMLVNGRVHANGNIWATGSGSSNPLIFSSYVEASGQITPTCGPNDGQNTGRSGNVNFQITQNNPLANANSLLMPIGADNNPATVQGLLELPPSGLAAPGSGAYSALGQNYPYNEADLIISNSASGTNLTVIYQSPGSASILTKLPPDATNVVTAGSGKSKISVTNTFYSFVTNVSFYDYREYSTVKAVQIDVAKLNAWLANTTGTGGAQYNVRNGGAGGNAGDKGHWINSIYVYNNVPQIGGTPSTAGQLPAVRLVNGPQLPPDGLTVATPQPLYVEGNYNVTTDGVGFALTLGSTTNNTVPAGLMGDSITILSTNWNDANNIKGLALGTRKAADTTINAAALEGIVPSVTDGSGNKHYSGGAENFLRLLEDWSQNSNAHNGAGILTYNGSIVVMFNSKYATNSWQQTGNYYNPPNRQWGFDLNFTQPDKLPPMTPQVRSIVRQNGNWAAW